jgi:hypothetical protein
MLTVTLDIAAWGLAIVAASSALVRLMLGVLAAQVARKALKLSPASEPADRAHRLAVVRALLGGLRPPRN